jgi:hypothetical protein
MSSLALKQGTRVFDDGVARVRDIDLAVFLEYTQPRDIRKRIKRELGALEEFGVVWRATVARQDSGQHGGIRSDTEEFWLNKKQALFIAARGETTKADEVLIVLVDVFDAYESGQLIPAKQTPQMELLETEKNQIGLRMDRLETEVKGGFARVEGKLDTIIANTGTIMGNTSEILKTQQHRRREIKYHDEVLHISCVAKRFASYCPCCHITRIVSDGKPTTEFEIDHWFGRHMAGLTQTWPTCRGCNQKLRNSEYHRRKQPEFDAYQSTLTVYYGPLFEE